MPMVIFTPGGIGTRFTFSAETDANILAGQAVLVKATTHVGLACADTLADGAVEGLAIAAASVGFAASYATDGQLLMSDWSVVTGQPLLSPGVTYFLDPVTPGGMTAIPPSTPGQVVVALGEALSTTTFHIHLASPILL